MATYFGFDAYDVEKYSDPFVFISYKSEDSERVAVYARYLHDHGINVWYDNGLHAGSDWESYLMSVIEKPHCKAVLLFVSQKVAQSTVIPLETTQARACKKPTVAVYLEPGLDLEILLNKAIKVYVAQRQSVDAFIGSEAEVCAQVLEAAKGAMSNISAVTSSSADTLWKNARMFMMNARRSRSEEDINKARGYLAQLTEQEPSDYRGWLGLAMCACLRRPETLDAAHRQLGEGAKYYSYVVASGADDVASAEYTEVKSQLWRYILDDIRQELGDSAGQEAVERVLRMAKSFDGYFGHTEPDIKPRYDQLIGMMQETLLRFEKEAEAERLKREKEARLKQLRREIEAKEKAIIDQCEWKITSDGGVSLKKYIGSSVSYDIPAVVNGRNVTSIGERAFYNCSSLTSITIPNSVTSIDAHAFSYCRSLTSITIPDSVTTIGVGAFSGCSSLTGITIPDSVVSIGDLTFCDCSSLTNITIPNSVKSIGEQTFDDCSSLTSITIPDGVTSIGNRTFSGCSSLTSITIPDSVTSIGKRAFSGCSSLTNITIPDSVTSIGNEVFSGCSSLTSITIPDGVTSIGGGAFSGCSSLTSITIPDSVTSIGKRAFSGCSSLTSITIPDGVTSIGGGAFADCPSLTVYGTGGLFSKVRKAARKSRVKYKKIKKNKIRKSK